MLAGDGMSQVTKNLLDLTQRRNFYAGDLLSSVEILRNVTETFKRASYEPSSDDVQVSVFYHVDMDHCVEFSSPTSSGYKCIYRDQQKLLSQDTV